MHGTEPDVAAVDRVLSTARSVRRKLDFARPVAPEVLVDCIRVATQAPTGLGGENWRFMVVADAAKKRQLADNYRAVLDELEQTRNLQVKPTQRALAERLHEFPVLILVCAIGAPISPAVSSQVAFYGSILPAAWSLMLALRARSLGTTWTTLLSSRQREVAAILGIPELVTQTVMLPVAYTKDASLRPAERLDAREVMFWDSWGARR